MLPVKSAPSFSMVSVPQVSGRNVGHKKKLADMFILFKYLQYLYLLYISKSFLNQVPVIYRYYECNLIRYLVVSFTF